MAVGRRGPGRLALRRDPSSVLAIAQQPDAILCEEVMARPRCGGEQPGARIGNLCSIKPRGPCGRPAREGAPVLKWSEGGGWQAAGVGSRGAATDAG